MTSCVTTGVLGHELEREPVASDAVRPTPVISPQNHELCPQNFFDPALQRVAERSTLADIRYGERLLSVANRAGEVVVDVEAVGSGARSRVRALARPLSDCSCGALTILANFGATD